LDSLVDSNKGADGSSDATTAAEQCALESLVDNILLEASLEFEHTAKKPIIQDQVTSNTGPQATRFSTPKSSEDVSMAMTSSVPKKTQADTKYCGRNGQISGTQSQKNRFQKETKPWTMNNYVIG